MGSPSPPALPSAIRESSFSPAITAELERLSSSSAASQPLDLSRYEAQEPPSSLAPGQSPADALRQPLANAFVSASYLSSRTENLALLDRHGRNAWLLANYHLESDLRSLEKDLTDTKREIDLVNAARTRRQTDVRAEMQGLEENWRSGVGKVLETEIAVEELKAQIRQELRNQGSVEQQTA